MLTEEYSEFICEECNGTGRIKLSNRPSFIACPKCKGLGKLDWIEYITGEKYAKRTKNKKSY